MLTTYKNFLFLKEDLLKEKQLNIGSTSNTEQFGQVIILAGGAGSGKDFVLTNILNVPNPKVFDVDDLKKKIIDNRDKITSIDDELTKLFGNQKFDFKNPNHVSALHKYVSDKNFKNSTIDNFLLSKIGTNQEKLPNIVFNCTLKDVKDLSEISKKVTTVGYKKENIHIVWILNNFQIALQQNKQRSRTVGYDIMVSTHKGASLTMQEIVKNFKKYEKYMDGDIIIIPNQQLVDNAFDVKQTYVNGNKKQLFNLKRYSRYVIKHKGKQIKNYEDIEQEIIDKINSYVPDNAKW